MAYVGRIFQQPLSGDFPMTFVGRISDKLYQKITRQILSGNYLMSSIERIHGEFYLNISKYVGL